jgi:LuxR family transcriptional regulator, quorum-sensing system regulator BjaR1
MTADLSKSDLNSILDIIHASLACQSKKEFEGLIQLTQSLIPFSHARSLFGDCNEYKTKKMGAFKMITAFPSEWEIRYNEKDYYLYDNIAYTAFTQKGLFYWADFTERKDADDTRNKKSKAIMAEAASVGLKNGWLYSMQGWRSPEFAILSLAGEKSEGSDRSRKILEYLSPHLCLAIKRIIRGQRNAPARLTPRECEILSWTAAGKTAWETSEILNISRRTVEFHMGNILNKLDAVNSQQAIAIAISSGIITY